MRWRRWKEDRIGIIGLGYIGAVSAAAFVDMGYCVLGYDIDKEKRDIINNGHSPIEEPGLDDMIFDAVEENGLWCPDSLKNVIKNTSFSFVCVGTPSKFDGDINLVYLKQVAKDIGQALKETEHHHTVVFRSTMFPGSYEVLKEILEDESGMECGLDFDIAINPEFLRESFAIKDFFEPPYIVIGAEREQTAQDVMKLYSTIETKKYVVNPGTAQMIKYASNSWHALKVCFANEIGSICKRFNVEGAKVMGLFAEDDQLNISAHYMKPGFAYGGGCLGKDTRCLHRNAVKAGLNTPLISSIERANKEHIRRAIEFIVQFKRKKIGFYGLAFKKGTDDMRDNALLDVIKELKRRRCDVKIWDKIVKTSNDPAIEKLFATEDEVLNQEIVVLSNGDSELVDKALDIEDKKHLVLNLAK
jgi:GDP-mannose 6-dehydrogenase